MSDFTVSVQSNTNQLILHFDKLPNEIKRQLETKITQLTTQLRGRVKAAEPVRTGRLRAATRSFVDVRQDFVRGRVRILPTGRASRLGAAFGALEYGSTGRRFPVRSYRRQGGAVRGYRRRGGLRELRFLRGPAAAMRPRAKVELEAVVGKALHEFTAF